MVVLLETEQEILMMKVILTYQFSSKRFQEEFNTLRTGDTDLRFYIKLCKTDDANLRF